MTPPLCYRRHEFPGGVSGFLPRMRIGRDSKLMKNSEKTPASASDMSDGNQANLSWMSTVQSIKSVWNISQTFYILILIKVGIPFQPCTRMSALCWPTSRSSWPRWLLALLIETRGPAGFRKRRKGSRRRTRASLTLSPSSTASTWRRTPRASGRWSANSNNSSHTRPSSNNAISSSNSSSHRNSTTTSSSITTNNNNSTTIIPDSNSSSNFLNRSRPSRDNWFKVRQMMMMITMSQLRKLFLFSSVPGRGDAQSNVLFNQFGDAMGADASVDPEANKYAKQPQLSPRQQSDGQ